MQIQLTQTTVKGGKEIKTEIKEITEREYNLLTDKDTFKMFRRLGDSGIMRKSYTYHGYKVTYLSSISPDREIKIIRKFKFN